MTNQPRGTTLLFSLLLTLPTGAWALSTEAAPPADVRPPRALDSLPRVAAALVPYDAGAAADALSVYAPRADPSLPTEPAASGASSFPVPGAGETRWINDSTITSDGLVLVTGATLILRDSTLIMQLPPGRDARVTVYSGARLVLERSTIKPADASVAWTLNVRGSLDATDCRIEGATGWLAPIADGDAARAQRCVLPGAPGRGLELRGDAARIERSLVYNHSRAQALTLVDGAVALDNTIINNDIGILLKGDAPVARGNVLRFNRVGVWWSDAPGAVVQGNDLLDNYQDGLYGSSANGATLDASGNHWGGAPNLAGDSWGGAGVSVASYSATRLAPLDRSAEAPFKWYALRDEAWPAGKVVDGPIMARAGTVTIDVPTLDLRGFRLGSHAGATLNVDGAELRNVSIIVARGDDLYEGMTIRGDGTGGFTMPGVASASRGVALLVAASSPTITGSRFETPSTAIVQTPRSAVPPDGLVTLHVHDTVFEGVANPIVANTATLDLDGVTARRARVAVSCVLCASSVVQDTLIETSTLGLLDVLGQGLTVSGSSTYASRAAVLLYGTSTPTITSSEMRWNAFGVVAIGAQVTLASTNLYDDPLFGAYAAPAVIDGVVVPGRVRVDPTTFVGDDVRGDVSFVPPRKTSAAANPGRDTAIVPVIVTAPTTIRGTYAAPGPIVVRSGGSLTIERATVDLRDHLVAGMTGGTVTLRDARIENGMAVILHGGAPTAQNVTIESQREMGLALVDDEARVRDLVTRGAPVGLQLWSSRALVERSLFDAGAAIGVVVTNDSATPSGGPTLRESIFLDGSPALQGQGNPSATITASSFRSTFAVDAGERFLEGLVGATTGDARLDMRGVWWNATTGPSMSGGPGGGAWVQWASGGPRTVTTDPHRTKPWRASFSVPGTTTLVGQPFRFTDTSFDHDDAILSWSWSFGDGATSSERSPTHAYSAVGSRIARLTVVDAYGWSSSAEIALSVKAAPVAVLAAPAAATALDAVALDGAGSTDADGRVVAWRFRASDGWDSGYRAASNATHAFARSGTYTLNLTVKDDEGRESAPASATIVVANRAPVASFDAPPTATRIDPVALVSTSADADGALATLAWSLGDGATASGARVTHRYAALGARDVTLTATDDEGATATATRTITVVNVAPTAGIAPTPLYVKPGQEVRFEALVADPDGATPAVAWDLGDGATSSARNVTHAYAAEGDVLVTLAATDADGGVAQATREVRVRSNLPPTPLFSWSPAAPTTSSDVAFTDASVDDEDDVVAWAWDFGDGATSTERHPRHRFLDAGGHTVTLTATDARGASATATRTLVVGDVLNVRATPLDAPRMQGPVRLLVELTWDNGSAAPGRYQLAVYYDLPVGASTETAQWSAASGWTDAQGRAVVVVPGHGGMQAPGAYVVKARATAYGYAGASKLAEERSTYFVGIG